jgi:O-antigen ligase
MPGADGAALQPEGNVPWAATESGSGSRYLAPLSFAVVLVFFSALPMYVSLEVNSALQPLHWLLLALGLLIPVGLNFHIRWLHAGSPLLVWVALYTVLCLLWFALFGADADLILRKRLVALVVLVTVFATVSSSPTALRAGLFALVCGVLLAICNNLYEMTHPFSFVPLSSPYANPGRAAGLYLNANASAGALLFGMVLTVTLVPSRWRWLYVAAVGLGVGLTFSRAGMLGMVLAVAGLWYLRVLRGTEVLGFVSLVVAAALIGWWYVLPQLAERFGINPEVLADRVTWILAPKGHADFSQQERLDVAALGWRQFLEHPWAGNGIGSTETWLADASPHNVYIMLASDFGVLGLLIVPALVLALWPGAQTRRVPGSLLLLPLLLFWGFFSHNLLDDFALMTVIAVAGALLLWRVSE